MTERNRVTKVGEFDQAKADRGEYTEQQLEDFASQILYKDRADLKKEISQYQATILRHLRKEESYPALIADWYDLSAEAVSDNLRLMLKKGWVIKGRKEKNVQYYAINESADIPDIDETYWLKEADLQDRKRVEIYSETGTVDPSVEEGMYFRTHPDGREFRPEGERPKGKGFYK